MRPGPRVLSLVVVLALAEGPGLALAGSERGSAGAPPAPPGARPNVLLAIADDWGWPHAGAYGDPVVRTPTFDRLAREGVLFDHAYVASPSCTPSRAALLTGQWHWRLEESANLWSTLRRDYPVYPELLAQAGYHVGLQGKGWGPGRVEPGGRTENPAGPEFPSFEAFLEKRRPGQPFAYWFGSSDPHRDYDEGKGAASGMDLGAIRLFPHLPEAREVRSDVADYYWEVQRFDSDVGRMLDLLEKRGEAERTVVVVTGDNGMPFPRCKANLYDCGVRVPLVVRWPGRFAAGRRLETFVSLTDLAPTFLALAGVPAPAATTGRSLLPLLGLVEPPPAELASRDHVLAGKERHVPGQERPDAGGTPMRSVRTRDFLYIRNFRPDRWPAGTPDAEKAVIEGRWLADCDNGPTKLFLVEHQAEDAVRPLYDLAFAKRPAEELYDLRKDPGQTTNVAGERAYAEVRASLAARLRADLEATSDPRVVGGADRLEAYPYYGGSPMKPGFPAPPR
ncbi:MAG TPA: sulfatase [Vicinamibacteria bacterium]